MNDRLLQEVAHLLRKYYDDRGAKLENYAQKVISLVEEDTKTRREKICEINARYVNEAAAAEINIRFKWEEYKIYLGQAIEKAVCERKHDIEIYEVDHEN